MDSDEEEKGLEPERSEGPEELEELKLILFLSDEALHIVASFLCVLDLRSLAKAARRFSMVKKPVQCDCQKELPTICASIVEEGARGQVLRALHARQMDA